MVRTVLAPRPGGVPVDVVAPLPAPKAKAVPKSKPISVQDAFGALPDDGKVTPDMVDMLLASRGLGGDAGNHQNRIQKWS